jgi:hypothetical protein
MAGGGAGGAPLASNAPVPKPAPVFAAPALGGFGVPVLMYGPVARDGRCGRGSMNAYLLLELVNQRMAVGRSQRDWPNLPDVRSMSIRAGQPDIPAEPGICYRSKQKRPRTKDRFPSMSGRVLGFGFWVLGFGSSLPISFLLATDHVARGFLDPHGHMPC